MMKHRITTQFASARNDYATHDGTSVRVQVLDCSFFELQQVLSNSVNSSCSMIVTKASLLAGVGFALAMHWGQLP